ncbi:MAG: cupin domain-containing protein [Clostridia bacterium]|nr:cupin domain-containing protein [Clostridia bacterium]
MDLETFKSKIVTNVYHLDSQREVQYHNHPNFDELFYCFKGEGTGVFEDREIELNPGEVFRVPAGIMHTLKTPTELFVCSFLIPPVKD